MIFHFNFTTEKKASVPSSGIIPPTTAEPRINNSRQSQPPAPSKSMSLDLEHPPPAAMAPRGSGGRRLGGRGGSGQQADTKVFVVWLESYEDHDSFPAGKF